MADAATVARASQARLTWRQRVGLFIAGVAARPRATARRVNVGSGSAMGAAMRMYANARGSRFNTGLGAGGSSSADAELSSSLTQLRAASRQMVRDAPYAKRARAIVVNNVIGPGIGMQAQVKTTRDGLNKRVNTDIEEQWCEWARAENCHTGGAVHFNDLERMAMGQVFDTGECFIRVHLSAFGESKVRLALELVEAERLADNIAPPGPALAGADIRQGVEVDKFGRALAYWVRTRHPGDIHGFPGQTIDQFERVDASEMFHLRIVDRWPQTRGEPWMHTAIRKLDSMEQYSTSELRAAQADATTFGSVKTTAVDGGPLATNKQEQVEDGAKPEMHIEDGVIIDLEPGEELNYHTPTRPNTGIDQFLRYMLREVAAGIGVSYESLSRDYSQTTFSSGRLAILDDRDTWRVLQQWWLRSFRVRLHRLWLQQAVLGGVIASVPIDQYMTGREKFEAVKFKCRGWSWIDPTKEVAAYKEAEKAGYISAEDIIAQTANGLDIEDVVDAIVRSRELYEAADIVRDTDVAANNAAAAGKSAEGAAPAADPGEDAPPDPQDEPADTTPNDPPMRVVSIARQ